MKCFVCFDTGWVCENHSNIMWGNEVCCGGAGVPCKCNKDIPPRVRFKKIYCEVKEREI